jgi:hypothetical protein
MLLAKVASEDSCWGERRHAKYRVYDLRCPEFSLETLLFLITHRIFKEYAYPKYFRVTYFTTLLIYGKWV